MEQIQTIHILYLYVWHVTALLCHIFSSISDKGDRNMMEGEFQYLMCFFAGLLLKEVIGAILEFRQKIVKKDHNN